jgi:hypothetical protein
MATESTCLFTGSPKSTNAWRTYEIVRGSKIEDQDLLDTLAEPAPVPTTSIFSRTDGICAWQACLNKDGPKVENIEVNGSHCGLGHHPAVVYAIADRLAQPEALGRSSTATMAGATLSFRTGGARERSPTRLYVRRDPTA